MRRLAICLLVLLSAASTVAQLPITGGGKLGRSFADMIAEQRLLLGDYCRMDFMGARLSEDGWERIRQYTAMRENPDFSTVYIVSRFWIVQSKEPSYSANVHYMIVGRYEENVGYIPAPGTRIVEFETGGKELRITAIDTNTPFVSRPAAVAWLKKKLELAKNPSQTQIIETALKELQTTGTAGAATPAAKPATTQAPPQ